MTYFANTKKDFCLSDKMFFVGQNDYLDVDEVKEFIRLLKDVVKKQADEILQKAGLSLEEWHDELPLLDKIDKLAGEGLI